MRRWFCVMLCVLVLFVFPVAQNALAKDDDKSSSPSADLYNKAVLLYQKKHWGQAKELLHQYLAEYSDSPLYITCLYYLGYCYQMLGDTQEALSIYHKVFNEAKGEDEFWGTMSQHRIQELMRF